jgi:hypothetical protein
MIIVRAFFSVLIAVSVALVPATRAAAISIKPANMSIPGNVGMACCPCCNDQESSKSSAACALKCLNVVGVFLPSMVVTEPYTVEAALPSFVNDELRGRTTSPPTHPPPV